MPRRFQQVGVFGVGPLAGNPLAVVPRAGWSSFKTAFPLPHLHSGRLPGPDPVLASEVPFAQSSPC